MSPVIRSGGLTLNPAPPGSLLKRRIVTRAAARSGPIVDTGHLTAIRQLPCLKCGMEPCGEAAHIRQNSAIYGKRQAIGRKPDDSWSLPLCRGCHQDDPDSLHKQSEGVFFDALGLDPLPICEALYRVSPEVVKMRAVVMTFIGARRG